MLHNLYYAIFVACQDFRILLTAFPRLSLSTAIALRQGFPLPCSATCQGEPRENDRLQGTSFYRTPQRKSPCNCCCVVAHKSSCQFILAVVLAAAGLDPECLPVPRTTARCVLRHESICWFKS